MSCCIQCGTGICPVFRMGESPWWQILQEFEATFTNSYLKPSYTFWSASGSPVQTPLLFSLPLPTVLIGFTFSPAKLRRKIGYCGQSFIFFSGVSPQTLSAVGMALLHIHTLKHWFVLVSIMLLCSIFLVSVWLISLHINI